MHAYGVVYVVWCGVCDVCVCDVCMHVCIGREEGGREGGRERGRDGWMEVKGNFDGKEMEGQCNNNRL